MDSTPGGSFIPKRNAGQRRPRPQVGKRVYLFSYVAYIFFFGTLLGVAGIFLLNQQADKRLAENIIQLDQAQADFDRESIKEITVLDNKLRLAKRTLDEHVSLLPIFTELEKTVLATVQLNSFSYKHSGSAEIELEIEGAAEDFDAVLGQRTVLSESELFSDSKFTEISYGSSVEESEDGEADVIESSQVDFVVAQTLSITDLAYSSFVSERFDTDDSIDTAVGVGDDDVVSTSDPSVDSSEDIVTNTDVQ